MKYRVVVQPPAIQDIDEAFIWMTTNAPDRALAWLDGLEEEIQSLESFPERCPVAEESKAFKAEIRQLHYGKRVGVYRILFTIVNNTVRVLHVRHGRMKRLGKE